MRLRDGGARRGQFLLAGFPGIASRLGRGDAARAAHRGPVTIRSPPLPAAISAIEQTGARLGHAALYALPLAIVAAGWAKNDLGGDGVEWFGIAMPKLPATVERTAGEVYEDWARDIHMWLAYLMLADAVAHVAAVGKHRWIDRHDILGRMTIGRR